MYRLKIHLFSLVSIISLVSGALGLPARGALAAPGAAGAVPLDIVLVLDASEAMTYDAGQADPMRDPSQCNPVGGCHPFEEARQAAKGFVDRLGFPDDRAALVTFDGGARVDLGFSTDKAQVQAALDALQVVTYAQTQLSGLRCTQLTPLDTSASTAEKPQSKVWQHAGAWWTVLPANTGTASSNGTFLWKLVGTTWTEARKLSNLTGARADAKVDGDVAHILLENGSSTELVSIEYNAGTGTYNAWSLRPATSGIALPGNETATIDIDSTGRMWLATENGLDEIIVYHSASPYTAWEGPVVLASNVDSDDIAVVTAMPGNKVGVLWSDQNTRRFGFRTHSDGDPVGAWSADEVPASQSALNVGLGMADDHLNVAVASDGTLYAAVKTSYDTAGYPKIALLVRRPDGAWDDLHEVDQDGTRAIVQLDETSDLLTVIYTSSEGYNDMVYRQSGTQGIAFGNLGTLAAANVTDASGAKQNHTGEMVTIFHSSSRVLGTLCAPDLYTLTITSDHGTVTKNPDQATYQLEDVVQLTATPEDGWSFAAWTGDRTGTGNPISVVITGDMAITATYTLSATSPLITLHPTDQTASAGQGVSFSAAASGDPAPTLQWQVSTDGGATFGDIPGATSDPLTFTAASTDRGNRYRAVFTNLAGSATSNAALLRVTPGAFGKSTPPDGATNLGTTVDLAWGPSSGASSYQYCIAASAAGCTGWVDRGVDTFATVSGLNPSTTYYWHVRAVNDDGTTYANGSESAVWSFTAADAPAVLSVLRADPDNTNAASVDFTVTFSEAVTGVDLSDFSLTTTGVISPSITGVSGSGTTYTVSVHTGFGDHNGTIRLNVVDNDTVVDGNGTPLAGGFNTGEIYTIEKHNADTTGVFRPGNGLLYLKNQNTTGFADVAINYGLGGDYPVTGDWDGDGTDTIGIYRNGSFYLRNSNTLGFADLVFAFGAPGDQPIAGDWDGDGIDTVGVYRTSTGQFLLRNDNSAGAADVSFYLGNVGDVGIAGDWDGDGMDTTGVFRPGNGVIFLKNTNATGFADIALNYGIPGDQPVTGDWDGDGDDTIGVYRTGVFYLRNSNTVGFADIVFGLGNPGDMPVAGDWDGLP